MDPSHRTFSIELCLGRGGFGEVYRAQMASPTGLASKVALKVLRRDLAPAGQAVQRLRDEGALLARLNHPVILRVHDLVVLDGRVSLITEYVDGDDLERCLRDDREPIGVRALAEVLGLVASALDAAYNTPVTSHGGPLKLVHRDIKPSNIRIGRHGEVKLLDFGIARSDEVTREARTMADMMVGSPPYMAPERFLNADLRPASDVFALGAIGVEGLLGARLFQAPVPMLASFAIDRGRFEDYVEDRFARLPPGVPEAWRSTCRRMLAYDPDERPTAAEVARECELLIDELPGGTLARWCRERAWLPAQREVGELDGKVLSEGTLARTWPETDAASILQAAPGTTDLPRLAATLALEPPRLPAAPAATGRPRPATRAGRRPGWFVWLGGASVASVVTASALGVLGVSAAAGLAAWSVWERDAAAPVVAPIARTPNPAPRPAPPPPTPPPASPAPPAPDAPSEPAEPRPSTPERAPEAAPRQPAREIVVEEPAARPPPAAPGGTGTVVLDGDADVPASLVGPAGPVRIPGPVPAGRYTLRADFGEGNVFTTPVVVEPDARVVITCRWRGFRCALD